MQKFLFLLLLAPPLMGAEVLSWEDCVAEAARSQPDLSAARASLDAARARARGASAPFLPQLSAEASRGRSGGDGVSSSNSAGAALSLRQNLFSGSRDAAALKRAEWDAAGAEVSFDGARAAAGFALRAAFARMIHAQQNVLLASSIADRRAQNVRLIELRYQAGRENKGSFLRASAVHRQAAFEAAQASRALRTARRELARALGRPAFDVFEATGTLSAPLPPAEPPDVRVLAGSVPASRAADVQASVAVLSVVQSRADFLPDLSASGSLSRSGASWPPKKDRWSAGLNLSYPLFSGGRDAAALSAAKADLHRAEEDRRAVQDRSAQDLEDAFASYQDAVERVDVQRLSLEASEVRARIAQAQYASGLLSFEDWDRIEDELVSARKSKLNAERDAVLSWAAWERTQGKGPL
jgi:outer membrane protein